MAHKPPNYHFIKDAILQTTPLIQEIQKKRNGNTLVPFICDSPITYTTAHRLNKIVRKMKIENLDLFVNSSGGDLDATAKIVKLLRENCKKFSVIVPFYAKSAASLLALSADELVMCKCAELGPVDPQVRDPVSGAWVPAHSIREALAFIEGVTDPLVKLSLADRLPPLLMGAYREYQSAARQYIEEALTKLGENEKQKAISVFTERYLSHGYPIDRKICKDVGLNVPAISDELENSICDLHEIYQDLLLEIQRRNTIRRFQKLGRAQDEEALYELEEGLLVIQADSKKSIVLNGRDITAEIERDLTQPQGTTGNPPS
jgi:hypothetical protein